METTAMRANTRRWLGNGVLGAALALGWMVGLGLALSSAAPAQAQETVPGPGYQVRPGDILQVSVWKEPELTRELLVRPDGGFSFPLAGQVQAQGRAVADIEQEIKARIERYIPEPVVTVSVMKVLGNNVNVVGKVNRPGEYIMNGPVDVLKAISMAGGTTVFADLNDIVVLRRAADGAQVAIPFDYTEVEAGENLEQNILLQAGDVVVVP
jgi:polysaccharide export outer membrane protein